MFRRAPRHADAGRHPRLTLVHAAKTWIPAFAGMTRWVRHDALGKDDAHHTTVL
jgi:hypothetical protein